MRSVTIAVSEGLVLANYALEPAARQRDGATIPGEAAVMNTPDSDNQNRTRGFVLVTASN
ncbi:hypothetical protein DC522_32455 [Microvirga sp. KLBC 81]|nr:hypothetical protein DC522_32455 [Microvirga sp. KLBC 81]